MYNVTRIFSLLAGYCEILLLASNIYEISTTVLKFLKKATGMKLNMKHWGKKCLFLLALTYLYDVNLFSAIVPHFKLLAVAFDVLGDPHSAHLNRDSRAETLWDAAKLDHRKLWEGKKNEHNPEQRENWG